jgi:hypothetical protein
MGRWDTGAITTGQCLRINICAFTPHIKRGVAHLEGTINYSNDSEISVRLLKRGNRYYAALNYFKTIDGKKCHVDYEIPIVTKPSNLGKGSIYYFLCPFSGKRCKVLYMGYGSLYFKSREAYRCRIYYSSQLSSRLDKHNDKYWSMEKKLEKLYANHPKTHYRGNKTKAQLRIERLEKKQQFHEKMRWVIVPQAVLKSMAMYGFKDARVLM